MRNIIAKSRIVVISGQRSLVYLLFTVVFVSLHSFFLGFFIYFFTGLFYELFFSQAVNNIFFVRQSGLFLMLSGLFYLFPIVDLRTNGKFIPLIIVSKCVAVIFLLTNARFTPEPTLLFLAALGDGIMAMLLGITYRNCKRGECFD